MMGQNDLDWTEPALKMIGSTIGPLQFTEGADRNRVTISAKSAEGERRTVTVPSGSPRLYGQPETREQYLLLQLLDPENWWIPAVLVYQEIDELLVSSPKTWVPPIPSPLAELVRVSGDLDLRLERQPVDDFAGVLNRIPQVIVLAPPGYGKTTLIRSLLIEGCTHALRDSSAPMPFLAALGNQRSGELPSAFLDRQWRQLGFSDAAIEDLIAERRVRILADGLNEIAGSDLTLAFTEWARFLAVDPGLPAVLTCRVDDYEVPLRLPQFELMPLSSGGVRELADKLLGDAASAFIDMLRSSGLEHLSQNPMSLTLMAWLFANADQSTPTSQLSIVGRFIGLVLQREFSRDGAHKARLALSELRDLAWRMQSESRLTLRLRTDATAPAHSLIERALSAGILDRKDDSVHFRHHQYQECLVGQLLALRWEAGESLPLAISRGAHSRFEPAAALAFWERLPPPEPTGWEQPILFAAAELSQPDEFVKAVSAQDPLCAAAASKEAPVAPTTREAIARHLVALIRDSDDPATRVAAGDLLSELGDPRPGVMDASVPGAFVSLTSRSTPSEVGAADRRGGRFPVTVGQYEEFVAESGYSIERFWSPEGWQWRLDGIGKDGVVAGMLGQREFLASSGRPLTDWQSELGWGPQTLAFWKRFLAESDDDAQVRVEARFRRPNAMEPGHWREPEYRRRNAAVVGVTYHEATAFARWLSEKHGSDYQLQSLRDWRHASAGDAADALYPWGSDPVPGAANTVESHILRPTAVGVFPRDRGMAGGFDYVGNVREWTGSLDDSNVRRQFHVVGGAWSRSLRVATRQHEDSFAPDFWDYNLGFRLIRRGGVA